VHKYGGLKAVEGGEGATEHRGGLGFAVCICASEKVLGVSKAVEGGAEQCGGLEAGEPGVL
jgi:hypothetical protein